MSRHRHVRNIDYDDYDDDYSEDYSEEEEDTHDEEAARYLVNSSQSATNTSAHQSQQDAIRNLCDEFSRALNMQLTLQHVEAALTQADFNKDAALSHLRAKFYPPTATATTTETNAASSSHHHPLTLDTPSAIGLAVTQQYDPSTSSSHFDATSAAVAAASSSSTTTNTASNVVVGSGRALYPSEESVERFDFQDPSPDDVILAMRGRGRERVMGAKLRLPKPSMRVPMVPPRASVADEPKPPQSGANAGGAPQPVASASSSTQTETKAAKQTNPKKSNGIKAKKLRVPKKTEPRLPKSVQQQQQQQQGGGKQDKEQTRKDAAAQKKGVGTVQRVKAVDVSAATKQAQEQRSSVSIVVAGHVDAGKSTLLGQLLQKLAQEGMAEKRKGGKLKDGHKDLAWITDQDAVERERGVTIDFCMRDFELLTKGGRRRCFAMLDAPGHRDFVPAMIAGATQAAAAVLVVDASRGEFEAGMSEEGQTREHAVLLRAVGISKLVVAVNKMDMVDFDKTRYDEVVESMRTFLKTNGWKAGARYVPLAGRAGVNVVKSPPAECPLSKWYKGPTFLDALVSVADSLESESDKRAAEEATRPTRLLVSDAFRSTSLGGVIAVSGRLLRGTIAPRDALMVCPSGLLANVKNIEVDGQRVKLAIAGVHNTPVSISLTGVPDTLAITPGDVLSDPVDIVPFATKFRAQVVVRNPQVPLLQGSAVEVHIGGGCEAGTLHKLVEFCSRGNEPKKRPRRLVKGDTAIVEVKLHRAACVERSADVKHLGFFTLRAQGRSVALGIVLDVLKTKKTAEKGEDNAIGASASSSTTT